jgi:hypothetical protein
MPNITAGGCKSPSILLLVKISSLKCHHFAAVPLLFIVVVDKGGVMAPISLQHKTGICDS